MLFCQIFRKVLPSGAGTFECGFCRSVHRTGICKAASIPEPEVLICFAYLSFSILIKDCLLLFYTSLIFRLSASSAFNQTAYAEQKQHWSGYPQM